MILITPHLTLAEVTRTSAKAPNVPTPLHLENIKILAEKVFEPLRALVDAPITVNSVYRSKEVNALTKGASLTSQHCKGQAMDIEGTNVSNATLGRLIKDNLTFDQLIFEKPVNGEPSWIHVSYSNTRNRKQVLIFVNNKYIPFNTNLINK
jgi:putative chitinase